MSTPAVQASCNPEGGAVSRARQWSAAATGWALVALGFTLPLATSGTSILLGVILFLWIAGGNYREKLVNMRRHPLAFAALILFVLHLAGLTYGKPSERIIFDVTRFLLLALFIGLFHDEAMRRRALYAFVIAALVLMVLSYLTWLNLLPQIALLNVNPPYKVAIQDRITHAFFVALAAYFLVVKAFFVESWPKRLILSALTAVALFNVLAVVDSKTTYLIVAALLGYLLVYKWRGKGAVACILIVAMLAGAIWLMPASAPHRRIAEGIREFRQWQPDRAQETSTGYRLEFYRLSLRIIRENPLIGVGVGGFAPAFAGQIKDPKTELTDNPHNEFLFVTTQLGLIGFLALLYLFYTQWRLAARLPTPQETIMARGTVLAFIVGCLFNSFLTDFDEGVFFIWISALFFSGYTPGIRKSVS